MDLFILDKLVIALIHKLMTDSVLQFAVLAVIGAYVNAKYPDKSKDKRGK